MSSPQPSQPMDFAASTGDKHIMSEPDLGPVDHAAFDAMEEWDDDAGSFQRPEGD